MGYTDDRDEHPKSSSFFTSWFQPGDLRHLEQQDRVSQQPRRLERDLATDNDNDSRETNPFVAFKNFVDGHLAAIVHLPSNIAELRRRAHEEEAAQRDRERDLQKRWTGHDHLDGTPSSRYAALSEEAKADAWDVINLLATTSSKRLGEHITDPGQIWDALRKRDALYYDPEYESGATETLSAGPNLSIGGACYYKSEANDNLPSLASLIFGTQLQPPRWLSIDWFKHSPYSPINLEADPGLTRYDTKWRHAFEDLLEAALDKRMSSQERFGIRPTSCPLAEYLLIPKSTWRVPGLDWMLSLQCRGILPLQIPSAYLPSHLEPVLCSKPGYDVAALDKDYEALLHEIATPDVRVAEENLTELDVYEKQCPDEDGRAFVEGIRQEREIKAAGCPDTSGREVAQAASEEREYYAGGCPDPVGRAIAQAEREECEFAAGGCPDPLGREVARAARYGREYYTRGCPKPLDRAIAEAAGDEREDSSGGCPDSLGRYIAQAAREEREDETGGCPDPLGLEVKLAAREKHRDPHDRAVSEAARKERECRSGGCQDSDDEDLSCNAVVYPREAGVPECHTWTRSNDWTDELRGLLADRDRFEREFVKACQLGTMSPEAYLGAQMRIHAVDARIRSVIEGHEPQMRTRARLLGYEQAVIDLAGEYIVKDTEEDDADDLPGELWSDARRAREQLAYEQAGDHSEQPTSQLSQPTSPTGEQQDSRILASLTTKHTTTMPDGTVVTIRTLKTRFADGSEDSHESVHTSHDGEIEQSKAEEKKEKKMKGWFWS